MKTAKKALALLLCLITVFSAISVTSAPAEAAEDGITVRINALKTKFPHGKFWNHYVTKASEAGLSSSKNEAFANSVTSHWCASHSANAKVGQYECNYFDGGIQCWGFAVKVFYDIFGVRASKMAKRYDTQNIKVGDYLRFGTDSDGHSAVVIARSGNTLTLVEGNFRPTGSTKEFCHINWGRTVNLSSVSYYKRASNYDTVKNSMNFTLDVNVNVDGTAYNTGHNNVTFDVYIGNTLKANDVKDFSQSIKGGSTYEIKDIKVTGCFARVNSNIISGKLTANTSVVIPITVKHTPVPIPETPAKCLTEGKTAGEKCSVCGVTLVAQEPIPAGGHSYTNTTVPPTCNTLQQVNHDCNNCVFEFTETDPALFTSWSEKKPPEDALEVQTKTEYRYAEREESWQKTETGTIDYALSWPSGFNKSHTLYTKYNKTPLTNSETETEKTVVTTSGAGYIYWHWCRGDYTSGPINRKIGNQKSSTYDTFHAFYSATNTAVTTASNARKISNGAVCKDTYWWTIERIELKRCTYTKYKKVNSDGWGQWSDWQEEEIKATDNIKVETRTLYRYVAPSENLYAEHKWSAWALDGKTETRKCSVCKKSETGTVLLIGDANYDGSVTASDARIALRASVALEKTTSKLLKVSDIDKNGNISASDARLILRASVGLEKLGIIRE